MVWLGIAVLLSHLLGNRSRGRVVKRILFAWLCFLSFILFALLAPLPAPKLVKPDGYTAVDFHSHTHFSHDGVVSPAQSLAYHRDLGFDKFFVTEHGHTASFSHFPKDTQLSVVFPGMQVQTPERISLLVLADRPYNGADFTHRPIKEVIDLAHARGFVVVCPHWWKWRYPTWDQLYADGIDGFEIYNAGYRKFPDAERAQLAAFCMEKDLLVTGSTDWHGWGRISNVWTVLRTSGTGDSFFSLLRQHTGTRVLVNRQREANTTLRYVFEPFACLYYYFGSMGSKELSGWFFWIMIVYLFSQTNGRINWRRLLSLVLGVLLFILAIYYLLTWIPLLPENQILGKLLAPILVVVGFGWLTFARTE
jgi:hypothetical protein